MYIRKSLFNIFNDTKDKYDLYEKVVVYIEKVIDETKGNENVEFYEVLRQLSTSINNAGWEERHSQHIDIINKAKYKISDKYEEYLP